MKQRCKSRASALRAYLSRDMLGNTNALVPIDHPTVVSLAKFGLTELGMIVYGAPQPDWHSVLKASGWKASRSQVQRILDQQRLFFLNREYHLYFDEWFYKDAGRLLAPTSFQKAIDYLKRYGDVIHGYSDAELQPALSALENAIKIKATKPDTMRRHRIKKEKVWPKRKKRCSFTSSTFYRQSVLRLFKYLSSQRVAGSTEPIAGKMRRELMEFIAVVVGRYYGISLSLQMVKKVIDEAA